MDLFIKKIVKHPWFFDAKVDMLLGLALIGLLAQGPLVGCGQQQLEDYSLQQDTYSGKIRLNLNALATSGKLVVATPPETTQLQCMVASRSCMTPGESAALLKSLSKAGAAQIFALTLAVPLANDLTVQFMALDASGKTIDQRAVKFTRGAPTGPTAPSVDPANSNGGTVPATGAPTRPTSPGSPTGVPPSAGPSGVPPTGTPSGTPAGGTVPTGLLGTTN